MEYTNKNNNNKRMKRLLVEFRVDWFVVAVVGLILSSSQQQQHHQQKQHLQYYVTGLSFTPPPLLPPPIITSITSSIIPIFGIGSIVFPVRESKLEYVSSIDTVYEKRMVLSDVSDFFVDSFWTGKVGGGTKQLTNQQKQNLQQSQNAEFTKRYGGSSSRRQGRRVSELIVSRHRIDDTILGCVGVEIDRIADGSMYGPTLTNTGPLMSNLAISRRYRRRGLAEKLVSAVEVLVHTEWGYDECYLYVEEQNRGAVKLYTKLGYKTIWKDNTITTLLPTSDGDLKSVSTVLLCMKKELGTKNIFSQFFVPFLR